MLLALLKTTFVVRPREVAWLSVKTAMRRTLCTPQIAAVQVVGRIAITVPW
jgi:hypothetical protein